jgi:hypothetical protein
MLYEDERRADNFKKNRPVNDRQGHKHHNTNTKVKQIKDKTNKNKLEREHVSLKRNSISYPTNCTHHKMLVSKAGNFKMRVIAKLQTNADYINLSSNTKKACKQKQHLLHLRS